MPGLRLIMGLHASALGAFYSAGALLRGRRAADLAKLYPRLACLDNHTRFLRSWDKNVWQVGGRRGEQAVTFVRSRLSD
jgi:hypothetical protein